MSKSAIYAINTNTQELAIGDVIPVNTIIRRFGCNCNLYGNGIGIQGTGYYKIDATVVLTPEAVGTATVNLYMDGVPVPGAVSSEAVGATQVTHTASINALVRQRCCDSSTLTLVLTGAASTISNVSMVVEKI